MTESTAKPIVPIGCDFLLPLNTPVTEGGMGARCGAGVVFANADEFMSLSLSGGFSRIGTTGEKYQDSYGAGTGTKNGRNQFGLRFGFSERGKFAEDSGGHTTTAWRFGQFSEVTMGWINHSSPNQSVFGSSFSENSDSQTLLTLAKEHEVGLEIWAGDSFHFMPKAGIRTVVMHPFGGYDEWPFSPFALELMFGLEIAIGEPSHRLQKGRELSPFRLANILVSDLLFDPAYAFAYSNNFSKPQTSAQGKIDEVFGGNGGGNVNGGSLAHVPSLNALSASLDSESKLRIVRAYPYAPNNGWKGGFYAIEAAKFAAYTAGGAAGVTQDIGLLSSGFIAANNLATMGMSEAINKKYLFLFPYFLGGAETLISMAATDSSPMAGILGAGTSTARGWASDAGAAEIDATSGGVAPAAYKFLGNSSGWLGGYKKRQHFKDSPLFMDSTVGFPAAFIGTFGQMGINQARSPENKTPYNLGAPGFISSLIGAELFATNDTAYFRAGIAGGFMTQYDPSGATGGAAANGSLSLGFYLPEELAKFLGGNAKAAFEISADTMGYVNPRDYGAIVTPTAGLRFWN